MDGQRIQLVSTASSKELYTQNTQSHFRNAFPQALPLNDGTYEIALTEISCASAIANIDNGVYVIYRKDPFYIVQCKVEKGRHSDINTLLLHMKNQIDSERTDITPQNEFHWS